MITSSGTVPKVGGQSPKAGGGTVPQGRGTVPKAGWGQSPKAGGTVPKGKCQWNKNDGGREPTVVVHAMPMRPRRRFGALLLVALLSARTTGTATSALSARTHAGATATHARTHAGAHRTALKIDLLDLLHGLLGLLLRKTGLDERIHDLLLSSLVACLHVSAELLHALLALLGREPLEFTATGSLAPGGGSLVILRERAERASEAQSHHDLLHFCFFLSWFVVVVGRDFVLHYKVCEETEKYT